MISRKDIVLDNLIGLLVSSSNFILTKQVEITEQVQPSRCRSDSILPGSRLAINARSGENTENTPSLIGDFLLATGHG